MAAAQKEWCNEGTCPPLHTKKKGMRRKGHALSFSSKRRDAKKRDVPSPPCQIVARKKGRRGCLGANTLRNSFRATGWWCACLKWSCWAQKVLCPHFEWWDVMMSANTPRRLNEGCWAKREGFGNPPCHVLYSWFVRRCKKLIKWQAYLIRSYSRSGSISRHVVDINSSRKPPENL